MEPKNDFIFLISDEGKLTKAPGTPYEKEDHLQEIVANHPEVLLADESSEDEAIRWLLVKREAGIPDSEAGSDRWAVDHVLLDQNGIPTFVEVKRSSDTRIRREVVGQLLEYAANARQHWPLGRLRTLSEEQESQSSENSLAALLGLDTDDPDEDLIGGFWQKVDQNLREGRIRLLFVADRLPKELRAIIEFLNEKMQDVEVLGVELRQYMSKGLRVLVPRIVGQTEASRGAKRGRSPGRPLTEAEFLEACPEPSHSFFSSLLNEAERRKVPVYWGTKGFSLRVPRGGGKLGSLLYGFQSGAHGREEPFIQVYVKWAGNDEERQRFRQGFLDLGGFRASGEYTAELGLSEQSSIELAQQALELIWDAAARLRAGDSTRSD